MVTLAIGLCGTGIGLIVYTYALYPGLLKVLGAVLGSAKPAQDPDVWPTVSVFLPVYNEEHQIAETLESLLSLDYPKNRLQVLVVSDASTDGTDDIVRAYADRGVELLRLAERKGRAAAEMAATPHLSGEIVVSTHASTRVVPEALKPLIRRFSDREVGLASGRHVSVASGVEVTETRRSKDVTYETAIRDLEARVGSIVEASRYFYAIRHHLHRVPLPSSLSRDFAATLNCRERGYRAVSVPEAICYVPPADSPKRDYRRRVNTITRDLRTLLHKRRLMNPFRYGLFSWMLVSHRVCRWLVPWAGVGILVGLAFLAPTMPWARVALLASVAGLLVGVIGWLAWSWRDLPRSLTIPAVGLMGHVAAMHAVFAAMRGEPDPLRAPGRRVSSRD